MFKLHYKTICVGLGLSICSQIALSDDDIDDVKHKHDHDICTGAAQPILSVADFDGNGIVDDNDIILIKKVEKRDIYYAFYDINVDGELDEEDIKRAKMDLGLESTIADRWLALLFHRVKQYQLYDSPQEATATGFYKITYSLAGHGEHWTNIVDGEDETFLRPAGLNVTKKEGFVKGVFWAIDAAPVFEGGATDYPTPGGEWETQRVVAYADQPPRFTGRPDEKWHTHAGLCITVEMMDTGPELVVNQHTTFAECQARPSLIKDPQTGYNSWRNLWMLHAWMFDLNPNGFFANTHPCVDPDSPPEEVINGDREVPPFFDHHM
jgi:hypothetical protein